jgi:acyl dehydratase
MPREPYDLPPSFAFTARSRGRTITEADFSAMTNLTWTTEEIHTDKVFMEQNRGTERMLAGGCVLAFALGLATPAIKEEIEARGVKLIALVGYDSIRFRSPLFPGDTIYVEVRLLSLVRTSRPERGVVTFEDVLVDSKGRQIMSYTRSALCDVSASAVYDGRGRRDAVAVAAAGEA